MRFLIDAQLPLSLARTLTAAGYPADHASDLGLASATDRQIWLEARRRGAVIVTKDSDFVELAITSKGGPTVVWIRRGNTRNVALWQALEPLLPEIVAAIDAGERLIEVT